MREWLEYFRIKLLMSRMGEVVRRNRRPELTFGNEAAFCCGFGKAMS